MIGEDEEGEEPRLFFIAVKNRLIYTIYTRGNTMAKTYIDRMNELGGKSSSAPTSTSASDDYYKLAKEQEFSTLLDKEVSLENAKQNAMKYAQNVTNAQGFGSTGYGASLNSGIYNAYMNKAMQAENDYNQNIKNIDYQQKLANEEKADDRFKSVTTMLTQADGIDSMNKLLSDYGYGSVDANGNFNFNAQKPEGMSDDDWYQTKFYYNMQKNVFNQNAEGEAIRNEANEFSGTFFTDVDSLKNLKVTYDEKNGGQDTAKIGSDFDNETDRYWSAISAGRIEYGSVTKLTRDIGNKGSIYLMYTKNGIRLCTKEDYEKAEKKHEIVGKNGKFE